MIHYVKFSKTLSTNVGAPVEWFTIIQWAKIKDGVQSQFTWLLYDFYAGHSERDWHLSWMYVPSGLEQDGEFVVDLFKSIYSNHHPFSDNANI